MYWCLFLKQTSNALRGTIIYRISEILVLYIKLNPIILDYSVSWIYKHKDKQQS